MELKFDKMNGAGNDFVLVDNVSGAIHLSGSQIRWLCDRRRGIGADGIIVVESGHDVDFRMRYYNANGGEAEMCGNGARCVALFARALGLGQVENGESRLRFMTTAGAMEAVVRASGASISMMDATAFEANISLPVAQRVEKVHFVNTGVPHAIIVEDDVDAMGDDDIARRGRLIRNHGHFAPDGCNANFVSIAGDGRVKIRTYERGVEAETHACGTGSVAAAVALAHVGRSTSPVRLKTRGGDTLTVSFKLTETGAREVILDGPAALNFRGSVQLPQ